MIDLTDAEADALRYLSAAIVLADGRIVEDEVATYAVKLSEFLGPPSNAGDETRWILENAMTVKTHMSGPGGRSWLGRQVLILNGTDHTAVIFNALWSIAVSDRNLHVDETNILDMAFSLWPSSP